MIDMIDMIDEQRRRWASGDGDGAIERWTNVDDVDD